MAHNINTYVGRESAWHKLGLVTGQFATSEELLANEGFQYDVFKSQLRDGLGRPVEAWGTFRWNHADKANKDSAKTIFLGPVGENYTVIQHAEGFRMIDALVASRDGAHYETAGVLGKGEKVWALADLGHAIEIGGDKQKGYVLFSTGHDGSMSHSYRLTFTRVVCENTLNMALSEKAKAGLVVRHTKNAGERIKEMHATLHRIDTDVATVEYKLNFLAGKKLTRESMEAIFERLFPKKKTDEGESVDTTRRSNIIGDILSLYEINDRNAFPEQRGTFYNLLNAVTEYTDHVRQVKDESSSMFGSGDTLKTKAFDAMMFMAEMAEAVPERVLVPVAR